MFETGLEIGQIIRNSDIVDIFKCGNMGGMRRSKTTNTLVIVSDYTKGLYHDKWIGGVLHYTGMGKNGDQDINWAQNATLAAYGKNGVDVHLFEVMDEGEYTYCGRIELVGKPYIENQPGEDGADRKVWMFPVRPVPDNDVEKPAMFVFRVMDDYRARGKNVDAEVKSFVYACEEELEYKRVRAAMKCLSDNVNTNAAFYKETIQWFCSRDQEEQARLVLSDLRAKGLEGAKLADSISLDNMETNVSKEEKET